jgi:hypothetical protein
VGPTAGGTVSWDAHPPEHTGISPKPGGVLFIYLFHSAHIQFHQSHVIAIRARSQVCMFFSSIARVQVPCSAREGRKGISRVRRAANRCLWRAAACAVAALAACARVCGAVTHCSHRPSRVCWLAAVCGRLQSVLPLIVQCWALLGKCGLCVAKRACTMGEA